MTRLILGPMIGGLASNRANLWGRADGPGVLHAWIGKNPDLSDAQLTGKSLPLAMILTVPFFTSSIRCGGADQPAAIWPVITAV